MATRNTIRLLTILLIAVIIAGVALWFLFAPAPPPSPSPGSDTADRPLFVTDDEPATFNVGVFERSIYTTLNHQLVSEGALPVQPPPTAGKANPFL